MVRIAALQVSPPFQPRTQQVKEAIETGRTTTVLMLEYQRVLGKPICDRTWRKIKNYLGISEELAYINLVSACAELRKRNPYDTINRIDAQRYAFVSENLPRLQCTGYELYGALQRMQPQPSKATIYRWGIEIGCPMRLDKKYSHLEVQKWILKLISQTRFKFSEETFTTTTS